MDSDTILMTLVAEGETTGRADFKRELHLDKAEEKAEFLKDIISLANSAPNHKGYLLIGIDDARYIVGIDELEEERIQQLVHSHVRPSLILRCTVVPVQAPNLPSVGIIEVEGARRPYRVTIPIDKLKQDDIFVRHGSVVEKATPEEISSMEEESHRLKEAQRRSRAAETHLRLGNFREAIDLYSEAIRMMPTADLFFGRGTAYRHYLGQSELSDQAKKELAGLALKDLSASIRLTDSEKIELSARFERLRVHELEWSEYEDWDADIMLLKRQAQGVEYGEIVYLEYSGYEGRAGTSSEAPAEVLGAMDEAIAFGYKGSGAYALRAQAGFHFCDYGSALRDVNMAIAGTQELKKRVDLLALRANIQVRMRQFQDAFRSLSEARQLSYRLGIEEFHDPWGYIGSHIEDEVLWRCGLQYEFDRIMPPSARALLLVLVAHMAAQSITILQRHPEPATPMTGKAWIEERFAPIMDAIRAMVGNDFWRECENVSLYWTLPGSAKGTSPRKRFLRKA